MAQAARSPEWWKQQDLVYLQRLCQQVAGQRGIQCIDVRPGHGPARHFVVLLRSGEEAFVDIPYDLIQKRSDAEIEVRLRRSITTLFPPLYEGGDEDSQEPTGM